MDRYGKLPVLPWTILQKDLLMVRHVNLFVFQVIHKGRVEKSNRSYIAH